MFVFKKFNVLVVFILSVVTTPRCIVSFNLFFLKSAIENIKLELRERLVELKDHNKLIEVHIDRLRKFNVSDDITPSEVLQYAAADVDEFVVESIIDHVGTSKRNYEFRVCWLGFDPNEDT